MTEQAASKANQEEIKIKQSRLQVVQTMTTVLVTVFGALTTIFGGFTSWTSANNQEKLNMLTHEVARNHRFVEEIGKVTNTFSIDKEAQAKISLTRLYALAQNENDKTVLLNIATASGKTSLMATMIDLIEDDPSFQDPKNPVFQKNRNRVAFKATKNRLADTVDKKVQESNESDTPPPVVEAGLLDKLTPKGTPGWILLGKRLDNEQLQGEVITETNTKDLSNKNPRELITNVNLRDSEPKKTGQGEIVGIVSKGSKINIIRTLDIVNSSKETEVWVEVKVGDKGSS